MTNKCVLVTGSSRGIGKAIALKFAEQGYDVIINCSKTKKSLINVVNEIKEKDVNCTHFVCDVSDHNQVKSMFEEIYKKYPKLDVLVNNAGISHVGLFTDLNEHMWDRIMDINLKSVYNCCHFALPKMISYKEGVVINISSMWGNIGASCEVAYSASKGGVNALTKALSKELGPSNIRVNAIACGVINTEMNAWLDDFEKQTLIDEIPLMKFGSVDDVADLCIFLSEDKSQYLTGQVINLDGGI